MKQLSFYAFFACAHGQGPVLSSRKKIAVIRNSFSRDPGRMSGEYDGRVLWRNSRIKMSSLDLQGLPTIE